jgi:hypothetical protein
LVFPQLWANGGQATFHLIHINTDARLHNYMKSARTVR